MSSRYPETKLFIYKCLSPSKIQRTTYQTNSSSRLSSRSVQDPNRCTAMHTFRGSLKTARQHQQEGMFKRDKLQREPPHTLRDPSHPGFGFESSLDSCTMSMFLALPNTPSSATREYHGSGKRRTERDAQSRTVPTDPRAPRSLEAGLLREN